MKWRRKRNEPSYIVKKMAPGEKESFWVFESTNAPGHYLHFRKETKRNMEYVLLPGLVGACLWKKENADNFLSEQDREKLGLKLVPFASPSENAQKA